MAKPCLILNVKFLLVSAFVLCTFILQSTVDCIQCYVCDSKVNFECSEKFPTNVGLKPQPCDNTSNDAYCIKTTGIYAGELGTKRFCSSIDLGNYCKYVRQPTGTREYRACMFTCSDDACNTATPLYNKQTTSFLITILAHFTVAIFIHSVPDYL